MSNQQEKSNIIEESSDKTKFSGTKVTISALLFALGISSAGNIFYLNKNSPYENNQKILAEIIDNQNGTIKLKDQEIQKLQDSIKTYIPNSSVWGAHQGLDIPDTIGTENPYITTSVKEIIHKKGKIKRMPNTLKYTIEGSKKNIDISPYIESLEDDSIMLLGTFKTKLGLVNGLVEYAEKDYNKYLPILKGISSDVIGIKETDSYWDKTSKIQEFVRKLGYEYDLLYLGKEGKASILSDYQLPVLANLIIGNMDCNNKTGLFVTLCRANGILTGIGHYPGHVFPIVFYDADSEIWKYNKQKYITISSKSGKKYHGSIMEVTGSVTTNGGTYNHPLGGIDGMENINAFSVFRPK